MWTQPEETSHISPFCMYQSFLHNINQYEVKRKDHKTTDQKKAHGEQTN